MTDKLKELLRKEFPLWDMRGANEAEHHCELTLFHDRKRLHALLDAFDEPAVEAAEIEVVGVLCVSRFRENPAMENIDFQLHADIEPGQHDLMTVAQHRRIVAHLVASPEVKP